MEAPPAPGPSVDSTRIPARAPERGRRRGRRGRPSTSLRGRGRGQRPSFETAPPGQGVPTIERTPGSELLSVSNAGASGPPPTSGLAPPPPRTRQATPRNGPGPSQNVPSGHGNHGTISGRDRRGGRTGGLGHTARHRHRRQADACPAAISRCAFDIPSLGDDELGPSEKHVTAGPVAFSQLSQTTSTELATRLSDLMNRGQVECAVCLERVRREHPIWSCPVCHGIVHLRCARKWGSRGPEDEQGHAIAFRCPSCRAPSEPSDKLVFRCYCGGLRNPPLEPGLVPGSCGDVCGKARGVQNSNCSHRCENICHPGPCTPCTRRGNPLRCHCGRELLERQCGSAIPAEGVSCARVCAAPLSCGHNCQFACHAGDCGECMVSCSVRCFCGSAETELPCALVEPFGCGGICGKPLSCLKHMCERSCHSGDCDPCRTDPTSVTACPCGKMNLNESQLRARTLCTDPVPSCGAPCGQPLGCLGKHVCERRCGHDGGCKPCEKLVDALCRCGASRQPVSCGAPEADLKQLLECQTPCNDRLTCKNPSHRCQNICCSFKRQKPSMKCGALETAQIFRSSCSQSNTRDEAERRREGHRCSEVCGCALNCKIEGHTCDSTCGHTMDCPPCGILVRESLTCACGAEVVSGPYRCGTAPPPCARPCARKRPQCNHPCPDRCDHPGECPPCIELLRLKCVGGHGEARFVPCHVGGPTGIRCHRSCGAPLQCGIHACRKGCHPDTIRTCEESDTTGCGQVCGLPRSCGHGCKVACHPMSSCPETPCMVDVRVTCPCRRREEDAPCLRGGPIGAVPIGSDGNIRMTCDAECDAQRRIRAFASAIGTNATYLSAQRNMAKMSGGHVGEDGLMIYSPFLVDFVGREPAAVALFEKELKSIVLGKVRKVNLGCLPSLHRMIAHNMAELYMLESESNGKGRQRSIVIRHCGAGTKPIIPVPLLSEYYARKVHDERSAKSTGVSRSLLVWVPLREKQQSQPCDVADRVTTELKAHAGAFKIIGTEVIPGPAGHVGARVEFSTRERMEVAKQGLLGKSGIVVGDITETSSFAGSGRCSPGASTPVSKAVIDHSAWSEPSSRLIHPNNSGGDSITWTERNLRERESNDANAASSDLPDSWEEA
jgi:transcriptional repressor NF-X1